MIRLGNAKNARLKRLLCAMGDGEMRFKARLYRERQAAEGIFSDAQEEDIMGRTRCGTLPRCRGSLQLLSIMAN
jgi:hypothetical protein